MSQEEKGREEGKEDQTGRRERERGREGGTEREEREGEREYNN